VNSTASTANETNKRQAPSANSTLWGMTFVDHCGAPAGLAHALEVIASAASTSTPSETRARPLRLTARTRFPRAASSRVTTQPVDPLALTTTCSSFPYFITKRSFFRSEDPPPFAAPAYPPGEAHP
jgi:hypothetical protein